MLGRIFLLGLDGQRSLGQRYATVNQAERFQQTADRRGKYEERFQPTAKNRHSLPSQTPLPRLLDHSAASPTPPPQRTKRRLARRETVAEVLVQSLLSSCAALRISLSRQTGHVRRGLDAPAIPPMPRLARKRLGWTAALASPRPRILKFRSRTTGMPTFKEREDWRRRCVLLALIFISYGTGVRREDRVSPRFLLGPR